MSFKEYMKMLIVVSPIIILALIISFGISNFKLFIICVIVYPFILIKYFEWILNKFY